MNWIEKYTLYKLLPYKLDFSLSTIENERLELSKATIYFFDFPIIIIGLISLKIKKLI